MLSDARARTGSRIAALDAELARIISLRNGVRATGPDQGTVAADLAAADERYFGMAVDAVRGAGAEVHSDLDGYEAVLVNRTARLAGLGYTKPPADGRPGGVPMSAAFGVGPSMLDPLGALGRAALDNPEAVVGFLAGLAIALAGSTLVAGGVGVTVGTGGLAIPVGGGAAVGGWALIGIGGALMAASADEIARDAADNLHQTQAAGGSVPAPAHTQPSHQPDPTAEPTGEPTRARPGDDLEKQRSLPRQNESARLLAKAGYDVEQLPEGDVTGVKNPDFRIEGEIFDAYAPSSERARNIASQIGVKVEESQADRIVLNLADTPVDVEQMRDQLHTWPEPGLKEVIVIDKQGNISHLYP